MLVSFASIKCVLLSFADSLNSYKRVENNGWRIVSDKLISQITRSRDSLTLETSSKKLDFRYSKVGFDDSRLEWSCAKQKYFKIYVYSINLHFKCVSTLVVLLNILSIKNYIPVSKRKVDLSYLSVAVSYNASEITKLFLWFCISVAILQVQRKSEVEKQRKWKKIEWLQKM